MWRINSAVRGLELRGKTLCFIVLLVLSGQAFLYYARQNVALRVLKFPGKYQNLELLPAFVGPMSSGRAISLLTREEHRLPWAI